MKIRKAYKFRIKTKPNTVRFLNQYSGCCRFVWNKALAMQKGLLERKMYCLRYERMASVMLRWKHKEETTFLRQAPSQALQQTLMQLDRAIKDAFDKKQPDKRFPRFKKKGVSDSFRFPQGFKLDGNQLFLPKIGWISFIKSREAEGTPRNVTVSRRGQHWYVSIQVEQEVVGPTHSSSSAVGIDMGVARFATLSNGTYFKPLNSFKKLSSKLARLQKDLARKKKFSANWQKQKQKITKIHIKIADARNDYLHKSSTAISKNHAVVVLEDLRIRNMSGSSKGNMEKPGKNVRAKAGLNKSILDQGWFEFRRQLEYKQAWSGGKVVAISPQYTSQTCPECGLINSDNRKSQRKFECLTCGYAANADYVAAINILAAGHAVSACGEMVQSGRSAKQEPAKGLRHAA